jgi:protein TonB
MKRNEEKVPGFDEIIFENRNKEYGAYDLRKRYNRVKSLSVISAVAFCVIPVIALFMTTEDGTATKGPEILVIFEPPDFDPEIIRQPEIKIPPELEKIQPNIAPEVTTDTAMITSFIPITDIINQTVTDGDVNDMLTVVATTEDIVPAEPEIFVAVEEMPVFPGGNAALLEFIAKNIVYPADALNNNIQGRVILKFVVNTDGSVGRIEILRGIDPLLDQEAIRVVGMLPRFRPGRQNGVPVPVWHSVPVNFRIEDLR